MGLARPVFQLWDRHLRFDPDDPAWPLRDRFVLSAGHASMLLYSLVHLWDLGLPLGEIEAFRQLGSRTPGHPEYGETPGVEVTTGPLGQGFGNAVGMALAGRLARARYGRDGEGPDTTSCTAWRATATSWRASPTSRPRWRGTWASAT